jgi:spermidine synthase
MRDGTVTSGVYQDLSRIGPFLKHDSDPNRMILRRSLIAAIVAATAVLGATANAQENRRLLESRESPYNNIYVYREGTYVSMLFGHNRRFYTESMYNTVDDRELPVAYTRFMTASLIYAKKINSILEIGFGGGRTAWYLHRFLPNVPITSVELDPVVVELARKYFGIRNEPNFQVVKGDGRIFLANSKARYDIILIDAYRGPFVPFHLLTKEFYQIVKDHLTEGGVVAQNVEPSTMLFDSAAKTIHAVFPQLDFYLADGNVVTIALDGGPRTPDDVQHMANQRQAALRLRYDLRQMLGQRRRLLPDTIDAKAKVLTDDFAPVEALKAIERHNRKWPDQ